VCTRQSSPDDTFGDVPDTSTLSHHANTGSERVTTTVLSTCEVTFRLLKGAFYIFLILHIQLFGPFRKEIGARGSIVVKPLCYKPEGRGFDTR
jgi:hypothetical protein